MFRSTLFFSAFFVIAALNVFQVHASAINNPDRAVINKQVWQVASTENMASRDSKVINSSAKSGLYFQADINLLRQQLLNHNAVIIDLPIPDGTYVTYRLTYSPVMHADLAASYPNIRTFSGVQVDQPQNQGLFDITPQGFHGVFNQDNEQIFIDPSHQKNSEHYHNYYRKDAQSLIETKFTKRLSPRKRGSFDAASQLQKMSTQSNKTTNIVTYKLAIATTGEYAQFHGGTKETALAALVTLVNRLNDVYQRDLAINFELVAGNDNIIFTNSTTDPFDNTDADIDVNAQVINDAIGVDNYDIGHVVGTGGGGLASFASVCKSYKAEGVTGSNRPTSDAFYIDYVAHEIGHQFGADHTFNATGGACSDNRVASSAFEPGSASTIMGYAGICGGQNLQNNSDPYFHIRSIDQIRAYSATLTNCGTPNTIDNEAPTVDAGADYTIPAKTPFTLNGSANDTDNDNLSYSWEQFDLGAASANAAEDAIDDGERPLFRAFSPQGTAERSLPKLADVLSSTSSYGEALPSVTRTLNFRLVVRDNANNLVDDAMTVNVIGGGNGFSVDDIEQWDSFSQTVTWQTANTENAPVSCSGVDILLSTDSGTSFEHVIANNTANDGSEAIALRV